MLRNLPWELNECGSVLLRSQRTRGRQTLFSHPKLQETLQVRGSKCSFKVKVPHPRAGGPLPGAPWPRGTGMPTSSHCTWQFRSSSSELIPGGSVVADRQDLQSQWEDREKHTFQVCHILPTALTDLIFPPERLQVKVYVFSPSSLFLFFKVF